MRVRVDMQVVYLMSMNKTESWSWNILRTTVSVVVLILNEICIQ